MSELSVPEILSEAAKLYEERRHVYGDNYKNFGKLMLALMPAGVNMNTEADLCRLGIVVMIASKLQRYCVNIESGGHQDSARDLIVYSAMLEEMTEK